MQPGEARMVEELVAKVEMVDQRTEPLVYHGLAEFAQRMLTKRPTVMPP